MPKRAFITGITGQDGSYLAELLISKGYEVHGLVRKGSLKQKGFLDDLKIDPAIRKKKLLLHAGDLNDGSGLTKLFKKIKPDEVYHLGGQSHVGTSVDIPEQTFETNVFATLKLLECIRNFRKGTRFFHAASCDMYGNPSTSPQSEETPFRPLNPYACSKAASHFLTVCYRKSYGLFACNGILYNHESPRRGENFVTRKIARGVAAIKKGTQKKLKLGNLDACKDWGYAPEYVEAMWRMLQAKEPDDYVVATGEGHIVQEFVEAAFQSVGLNWRDHVEKDPAQLKRKQTALFIGDASKAKKVLGWEPRVRFKDLVRLMVEAEMRKTRRQD